MTRRQCARGALPGILALLAATIFVTACESDNNPYGVPYGRLDRFMAGVYDATSPSANLGMRLLLGSRHTVSGRYEDGAGGVIRFNGTWERQGDKLLVTLEPQTGLPPVLEFDVSRETILTEIEPGRFSLIPETAPPTYLEQDVMRLRGVAVFAGTQLELDLIRVITDIVGGSGGGGPVRS